MCSFFLLFCCTGATGWMPEEAKISLLKQHLQRSRRDGLRRLLITALFEERWSFFSFLVEAVPQALDYRRPLLASSPSCSATWTLWVPLFPGPTYLVTTVIIECWWFNNRILPSEHEYPDEYCCVNCISGLVSIIVCLLPARLEARVKSYKLGACPSCYTNIFSLTLLMSMDYFSTEKLEDRNKVSCDAW